MSKPIQSELARLDALITRCGGVVLHARKITLQLAFQRILDAIYRLKPSPAHHKQSRQTSLQPG